MDVKAFVIERLPERYSMSVRSFSRQKDWYELRLRTGAPLAAVAPDGNYLLGQRGILHRGEKPIICSARELAETVSALCGGSGYRYFDTLIYGYLTLDQGIRLGVLGERAGSGSRLPEVLTSLNIRLPCFSKTAADPFLSAIRKEDLSSALVLSPPGGGKTTFLRALAQRLSLGFSARAPLRVAVADERRELFPALAERGSCDVLSGIPKADAIRRAIRLLSPQVMICDEIGGEDDLRAVAEAGSSGVVFFASCHAAIEAEALAKPGIASLIQAGVFKRFVVLERVPGQKFSVSVRISDPC